MAMEIETRTVMSKGQVAALPRLLDIKEVAGHLGVTTRRVRRLVAERRIPYLKWGHTYLDLTLRNSQPGSTALVSIK